MTTVGVHCTIANPTGPLAEVISLRLFDLGAEAIATIDGTLVAGFETRDAGAAASSRLEAEFGEQLIAIELRDDTADWVAQQRAGLAATFVAPFSIRPPWVPQPATTELAHDLIIDPGPAFGHGGHPSTQLTLTLLLRRLGSIRRVIDVGTGTGVLAIAAARCGVDVFAVDIDANAIAQAEHNIALNDHDGISDRIVLKHGELRAAEVDPADIIVANLTVGAQRVLASDAAIAHRVVLGGLLTSQIREVRDIYSKHAAVTIRCSGGWAAVDLSAVDSDRQRTLR